MRNCRLLIALLMGLATSELAMAQKSPTPHTTNQVNVDPQSGLVIAEGYNNRMFWDHMKFHKRCNFDMGTGSHPRTESTEVREDT